MKPLLPLFLLAGLAWLFAFSNAPAQTTTPAVREIQVHGKIALENGWKGDDVQPLRDGAAVKKSYEELKNSYRKLDNAVTSWKRVGEAPPKTILNDMPGRSGELPNPKYDAWKKRKEAAAKKALDLVPGFKSSRDEFQKILAKNLEAKILVDEKLRFEQTLPSRKILYFSAKKTGGKQGSNQGIWFLEASPSVDFTMQNKLPDCTVDPTESSLITATIY